jgi:hypothetical protein
VLHMFHTLTWHVTVPLLQPLRTCSTKGFRDSPSALMYLKCAGHGATTCTMCFGAPQYPATVCTLAQVWVWLMERPRTGSQDASSTPPAGAQPPRLSAAALADAGTALRNGIPGAANAGGLVAAARPQWAHPAVYVHIGPSCLSARLRRPAGRGNVRTACRQPEGHLSVQAGGAVRRNVARERRVGWERTMAELALQLGDLQSAICHALQVGLLAALGIPTTTLCQTANQCTSAGLGLATVVPQCASSDWLCVAILLSCWRTGAAPAGVPAAGAGAAAAALAWRAAVLLHGARCKCSSGFTFSIALGISVWRQQHTTRADGTGCPSAGGP